MITLVNIILAGILVFILAQPGKRKGEIEIKVATVVDPSSLPFWIAEEKGFFNEVGIKYKPNEVGRVVDELDNTVSGAFYASFGIDLTYALMRTSGDMKFVVPLYYVKGKGDGIIVRDTGIKGLADLKYKRIGYHQNTRYNVILDAVLPSMVPRGEEDTLDYMFEMVGLSLEEMDAALDTRRVDAVYLTEPYLSYFEKKGYRVVARDIAFADGFIGGMGITSEVNVSLRKDAVSRIETALRKAMDYIKDNPEEAKQILAKKVGMGFPIPDFVWAEDISEIEGFARALKERGLLPLDTLNFVKRGR